MDPLTVIVGGVGGVIAGWALKTYSDRWAWRRQQVLDAYVEVLNLTDQFSIKSGACWRRGLDVNQRTGDWLLVVEDLRQSLAAVDRAGGRLRLVAHWRGAEAGLSLYVACEKLFRRAVFSFPPASWERYEEASAEMVRAFTAVVEQGRAEMNLRHWRERIPGHASLSELARKQMDQLDQTDPLPGAPPQPLPPTGPKT